MDALPAIERIVGAAHVLTGDRVSEEYARDESLVGRTVTLGTVVRPASTSQVAAVVREASRRRLPVTARGAGTGLSGGCVPSPGGLVLSFERMAELLDVDTAGHTAVVQPGITVGSLNAALSTKGMVYPVYLGTDACTVGGTIATNAGGMRAVKHGVTRQQVLGLVAVTGTGDVLTSGGAPAKNASGLDLTQAIVGSEGTLALVTEATLRLSPLLPHDATLLAPFTDVDALAAAIPSVHASQARPAVLEYVDRSTMKALLRHDDLRLGVPTALQERTQAYLVVVVEGYNREEADRHVQTASELLTDAGALDVFVLHDGQGAQLLDAREKALWVTKAAGADDLVDVVVPRHRIPEYLRRVDQIARRHGSRVYGCGHAGDGNIHLSVYEPDEAERVGLLMDLFDTGLALGGAISGEHGIGADKAKYYQALTDPTKLALERGIKAVFDPNGILNPGKAYDTAPRPHES